MGGTGDGGGRPLVLRWPAAVAGEEGQRWGIAPFIALGSLILGGILMGGGGGGHSPGGGLGGGGGFGDGFHGADWEPLYQ